MLMAEVLAVIPARGGSKGISRKNLVPVGGIPLVGHSIRHALNSPSITRVIVSTEDEEIAAVSREYGAEVPFLRPGELADDDVLDHPVFCHALRTLHEIDGYMPTLVVHLRPTAPFRRVEWIEGAISLLASNPAADSVRSVSRPSQHPYRIFRIADDGFLQPLMGHEHPMPYLLRRQDLPAVYHYNCVVDVTRPATILQKGTMTGDRMLPYIIPEDEVFDVDTRRDLEIASILMEKLR
jgi:N-acylneuraminate cytidylyltransferase